MLQNAQVRDYITVTHSCRPRHLPISDEGTGSPTLRQSSEHGKRVMIRSGIDSSGPVVVHLPGRLQVLVTPTLGVKPFFKRPNCRRTHVDWLREAFSRPSVPRGVAAAATATVGALLKH